MSEQNNTPTDERDLARETMRMIEGISSAFPSGRQRMYEIIQSALTQAAADLELKWFKTLAEQPQALFHNCIRHWTEEQRMRFALHLIGEQDKDKAELIKERAELQQSLAQQSEKVKELEKVSDGLAQAFNHEKYLRLRLESQLAEVWRQNESKDALIAELRSGIQWAKEVIQVNSTPAQQAEEKKGGG